ncbi:hypothetical protein, partial [Pseudomonas aeruginosa]|uniref:hypothetical protein n=1 Tax=Pseudomonas aeruginosa TaxID=287 RepID=UPI0021190403
AKIFDGHTKGGQSAPNLEKEVQHYTSNVTIREKVDFTPAQRPIQLAVCRFGRGRQDGAPGSPSAG